MMPSFVGQGPVAVIPIDQTTSNALSFDQGAGLVGLQLPAALTSIAITFLGSIDGVHYQSVRKIDGTAYGLVVAAAQCISIPPGDLAAWPFLKLVCGTPEAAARTILTSVRTL
jgi:hypothetical protein